MSTVFSTIVTGVIVYVLGQAFVRLVIQPVEEFKRTVGRVAHSLKMYANVYTQQEHADPQLLEENGIALRGLSCELESAACLVPMYRQTRYLFWTPLSEVTFSCV